MFNIAGTFKNAGKGASERVEIVAYESARGKGDWARGDCLVSLAWVRAGSKRKRAWLSAGRQLFWGGRVGWRFFFLGWGGLPGQMAELLQGLCSRNGPLHWVL